MTRDRLGGAHSARSLMLSVDFGTVERLQHDGQWTALTAMMVDAAWALERGGADFFVLCTKTMRLMADAVAASVSIPMLHIVDPAAAAIRAGRHHRVGLLATAFTMKKKFYRMRLAERFGLDVVVPEADDRALVLSVIYDELVAGVLRPEARSAFRDVIARLVARGAEAIILGCTLIMLLIDAEDRAVPIYDTTALHARAAVDRALAVPPTVIASAA